MKIRQYTILLSTLFITILLMAFFVKGKATNHIYFQSEKDIAVGGPFELSNSTGRYALTEAIVKNNTVFLNEDLAKFASPDVVDYRGRFFSIFTPGVSFIGVPFYMVGELFGLPQLFTFFAVTLFGVLNVFLVFWLARRLGASFYSSIVSGLVFLFGSNALSYSLNFTQHQLSVTVMLMALFNVIGKRTWINNLFFGLIVGFGALADIPNLFLLFPLGVYILFKHFNLAKANQELGFTIKTSMLGIVIGLIPLFTLFGWYNIETTGSLTRLGQTIGRTKYFRANLPPRDMADSIIDIGEKTAYSPRFKLPFATRNQLTSLNILLLSNERSWIFYSPVLFVGLMGYFLAYKKKETSGLAVLAITVISLNVVLYSMFDDPWGGWAFGARYLVPAAAVVAGGIGITLDRFKKNIVFIAVFISLLFYSVFINIAGALTTSAIPPKIEAANLSYKIPYTYKYNFQLINSNFSSSLAYNTLFYKNVTARNYLFILSFLTVGLILAFCSLVIFSGRNKDLR